MSVLFHYIQNALQSIEDNTGKYRMSILNNFILRKTIFIGAEPNLHNYIFIILLLFS